AGESLLRDENAGAPIRRADLSAELSAAVRSPLASQVAPWFASLPAFRALAEFYRDKIRKKARGPRDDEGRRDFAFELAIAVRLLEERRFALEYESYGVGQRAPDFRVTFRSRVRFNVEVRRLRDRKSTRLNSSHE